MVGEVRKAPVIVRRQLFCTDSIFFKCVCAAFSNVSDPYSKMGLMTVVYSFVSVCLSPPQSVPMRALSRLALLVALVVACVICCLNVKCLSNTIPRNLAVSLNGMSVVPSWSGLSCVMLYRPKTMHCVFCGDRCRLSVASLSVVF